MAVGYLEGAEHVRAQIARGESDPASFRAALSNVAPADRDAWLDRMLGLSEIPDDEAVLPRGCVPYLPCAVDILLRVIEHAPVVASDVFVDIGSGVGRAGALVHLATGASVIGVEIQPRLVAAARDLSKRLLLSRVTSIEGDAANAREVVSRGSVFFLYCPFSGERLANLLIDLETIARTKTIRICSVDLPMPSVPWLVRDLVSPDLTIYRSTIF